MNTSKNITAIILAYCWSMSAQATPFLQLDIGSGQYNSTTQDTVATTNNFTLYGLINTTNKNPAFNANDDFTFSIALLQNGNKLSNAALNTFNFGSFTIQNTVDNVLHTFNNTSSNFQFGTPPPDATSNANQLSSHSIFDTWYTEIKPNANLGTASSSNRANDYDVATQIGNPVFNAAGPLAVISNLVDVSNLAAGYSLHFDFYTTLPATSGGTSQVDQNAPFSHDATASNNTCIGTSCNGGGIGNPLPEPSVIGLFGIGLIGLSYSSLGRKSRFN